MSQISWKCLFCNGTVSTSQGSVSLPNKIGIHDTLFICKKCNALTNKSSFVNLGSEHQATFHENLFGTSSSFFSSYIDDANSLRRLIVNDYPLYFKNRETELIFEVGAGRGSLLKALHDEGYTALGCEFSGNLVNAGREAYGLPANIFFQLDAWDLPKYLRQNSIYPTVIIFWHVIEHIEKTLALLESLREASSSEVTFIFQTPLPVPAYIFPEHLFFPTTETYHYVAERLALSVKLLDIVPFTRFLTCVLSNKDLPKGKIYPKQRKMSGFSVIGQLIAQLDCGLQELDQLTKEQQATIVRMKT